MDVDVLQTDGRTTSVMTLRLTAGLPQPLNILLAL